MGRYLLVAPLLVALALLGACRYRLAGPPSLPGAVRIRITHNRSREVRCQAFLHRELAREINHRLGWEISPTGEATLHLFIDEEDIKSTGVGVDDVPNSWRIGVRGTAMLELPGKVIPAMPLPFTGLGSYGSRDRLIRGLEVAGRNAAAKITDWLDSNAAAIVAAWHQPPRRDGLVVPPDGTPPTPAPPAGAPPDTTGP